jgi:DNA (cytosine-5)-methyltransferase 1
MNSKKIFAIDLFCGAGGLTHGFLKNQIQVIAGYDINPECKFAYEYNNKIPFIEKNIKNITGAEIKEKFQGSDVSILVGCAPCQPFSKYSNNKNVDERWTLLKDFLRIIKQSNPDIVSMENVIQLKNHYMFNLFVSSLKKMNYITSFFTVNCSDYGVPQTRKRLILFASKYEKINILSKTHIRNIQTVRHYIEHLPPLLAGEFSESDKLHTCSNLSEKNLKRIKNSIPGGTWKQWNKKDLLNCHKKNSGKTYVSVYGRMEWDKPSPTITTQCFGFGNGRFGHPQQNRAISLREAALLQTFPINYIFIEPDKKITFSKIGKMIGNAVPVRLGEIVAQSILNHINQLSLK